MDRQPADGPMVGAAADLHRLRLVLLDPDPGVVLYQRTPPFFFLMTPSV